MCSIEPRGFDDFLAENLPNAMWRPGSAPTRWGVKALPRPSSRNKEAYF